MKFKKGDKVKFKEINSGRATINKWYKSIEDPEDIVHGSTRLHKDYYNNFATVTRVNISPNYYMVRYRGDEGRYVILPFKEEHLETAEEKNWQKRISELRRMED